VTEVKLYSDNRTSQKSNVAHRDKRHNALPFGLGDPGSILGRISTQGLKIIKEKVLPLH
jgi:hypothetical protein